ncbi:MAG: efflux RND transporter periplasmic adaptor subunit [Planctomycetes bacterium]|nr:efflux RND transporter periplasmic adaptor subunit [Planctomycetota bacterium]
MARFGKLIVLLQILLALAGIGWAVKNWIKPEVGPRRDGRKAGPAPVEAAPVLHGPIERRKTFSGTLEARAEFVVAPKIAGRVEWLAVDLSDTVSQYQIVAHLDDDEFVQAVMQAEADLAVAKANVAEAESALKIAERELERVQTLRTQGIVSESQLDSTIAAQLAKRAALEVAHAQVVRSEAALQTAKIRLGYTKVIASWGGDEGQRVVAERFVNEGDTVSANAPLMSIVSLHPINGVVFVTEKDYGRLNVGQAVALSTDAYPDRSFQGRIARISPVFRQASRQARVEVTVNNPEQLLKPGMFVRADVVLDRVEEATLVPVEALARRDGKSGVFVVAANGETVAWRPVAVGIQEGRHVQVHGEGIQGRVVTLGQQLIEDGSRITIPESHHGEPRPAGP